MKLCAKFWDFAYGVLLIGAVPLAILWLVGLLLDPLMRRLSELYGQRQFFVFIAVGAGFIFYLLPPLAAFVVATIWRTRHRILPVPFVVLEAILGCAWAFFIVAYCALLLHE